MLLKKLCERNLSLMRQHLFEMLVVEKVKVVAEVAKVLVDLAEVVVEETVVGVAMSPSTINPGLDNSPLFGLKVADGSLNRNTYFASEARVFSGIAIVQANVPPEAVKLTLAKVRCQQQNLNRERWEFGLPVRRSVKEFRF